MEEDTRTFHLNLLNENTKEVGLLPYELLAKEAPEAPE